MKAMAEGQRLGRFRRTALHCAPVDRGERLRRRRRDQWRRRLSSLRRSPSRPEGRKRRLDGFDCGAPAYERSIQFC